VALALARPTGGSAAAAPDFASLQVQPYQPPKPAPAFALAGLDGKVTRLGDLRGKVVLVFFWATWSPNCREELPSVNRIYGELKGKGLEILLVNFREKPDHVRQVVRERGYVAPVLLDESGDVTGK